VRKTSLDYTSIGNKYEAFYMPSFITIKINAQTNKYFKYLQILCHMFVKSDTIKCVGFSDAEFHRHGLKSTM